LAALFPPNHSSTNCLASWFCLSPFYPRVSPFVSFDPDIPFVWFEVLPPNALFPPDPGRVFPPGSCRAERNHPSCFVGFPFPSSSRAPLFPELSGGPRVGGFPMPPPPYEPLTAACFIAGNPSFLRTLLLTCIFPCSFGTSSLQNHLSLCFRPIPPPPLPTLVLVFVPPGVSFHSLPVGPPPSAFPATLYMMLFQHAVGSPQR